MNNRRKEVGLAAGARGALGRQAGAVRQPQARSLAVIETGKGSMESLVVRVI